MQVVSEFHGDCDENRIFGRIRDGDFLLLRQVPRSKCGMKELICCA